MVKVIAPKGLRTAGTSLWGDVTSKYELRVDERVVLEKACRASDRLVMMEDELGRSDLMTTGSTGQPVVHPLVAEIRAHEALVASLLGKIRLPDDPAGAGNAAGDRSASARQAAQSRWASAHGASA